jgi:hypothetical protein
MEAREQHPPYALILTLGGTVVAQESIALVRRGGGPRPVLELQLDITHVIVRRPEVARTQATIAG